MFDKIKAAAKYVKDKFVATFLPKTEDGTPPEVDTSRYLHVSVGLQPIKEPLLRKLLGRDYTAPSLVGTTYNVGKNYIKRAADALGQNNKERRRLRTMMKRRAAVLSQGAA